MNTLLNIFMQKSENVKISRYTILVRNPRNDLPLHIQDKKVRNSLFADDSSLDTSGKTVKEIEVTLQKSRNDVSGWSKNNLCLNPEKNKCMVIATSQKHQRSPHRLKLDIDSKTVVQVKEHRVLGIPLMMNLNGSHT